MQISQLYSPNFDNRNFNPVIDTLVIHHTNMISAQAALERLCDRESKVSCHYLIDKDGIIYQLIPDHFRAWHAGISYWRGRKGLNEFSIGIELDNTGNEIFPLPQMQSLIELCKHLLIKHPIEQRNIIAHYDIAPDRKDDPSHHFNWELLAQNGIGLFPILSYLDANKVIDDLSSTDITKLQKQLSIYGYKINLSGEFDLPTKQAIIAFKRHFCMKPNDHSWDTEAEHKLNRLMSMINEES